MSKMEATPSRRSLPSTWCLYAHHDDAEYCNGYVHLMDLRRVYDVVAMWQHGPPVDVLMGSEKEILISKRKVSSLSLFRSLSLPEWEHPTNTTGCTLSARLVGLTPSQCADVWWKLIMRLLTDPDAPLDLMGVQISHKRNRYRGQHRLDAWLFGPPRPELEALLLSVLPSGSSLHVRLRAS